MVMTCTDCIHYAACKNAAYEYDGGDAAYEDGGYCEAFAQTCINFSDKTEWFHLSGKDSTTVYYSVGYGDEAKIIEEPICGWGIKNGKQCVIDECGDFYELGKMVFLTKEEAKKEVERRKNQ